MHTSDELVAKWRVQVADTARPYLWSRDEVYMYANEAYMMFWRLVGGFADFTSEACEVEVVANNAVGEIHPSVLRVTSARRRSDGKSVGVISHTDVAKLAAKDYGLMRQIKLGKVEGPVRYMVTGMQREKVVWIDVPMVNDVVDLTVYRLPLNKIDKEGAPLEELDEIHHVPLMLWMDNLAYTKPDADTYDPARAEVARQRFVQYCDEVKREWERYKHKPREVMYGGI